MPGATAGVPTGTKLDAMMLSTRISSLTALSPPTLTALQVTSRREVKSPGRSSSTKPTPPSTKNSSDTVSPTRVVPVKVTSLSPGVSEASETAYSAKAPPFSSVRVKTSSAF